MLLPGSLFLSVPFNLLHLNTELSTSLCGELWTSLHRCSVFPTGRGDFLSREWASEHPAAVRRNWRTRTPGSKHRGGGTPAHSPTGILRPHQPVQGDLPIRPRLWANKLKAYEEGELPLCYGFHFHSPHPLLPVITSSSNREYTITLPDGTVDTRSYQWRQTITFQSCPHSEDLRTTQQLSVDQIFVWFDDQNELIRYAMTNKMGSVHSECTSFKQLPKNSKDLIK